MKLFRLSQSENNSYDTYDSCIVCALTIDEARAIHPGGGECKETPDQWDSWCGLHDVEVEYIGEAVDALKKGVICASFNAG